MLELRPTWCAGDSLVEELIEFGAWSDGEGRALAARGGDEWRPGDGLRLRRVVRPQSSPLEIRQKFGLPAGASVGVAARWSCRSTAIAGVHTGGPGALALDEASELTLDIPAEVGGVIEVETCLVVRWPEGVDSEGQCPDGAMVWSDGWSTLPHERSLVLEGAELRIPVRSVSFEQHFDEPSRALWAIDVDNASMDDLVSAVVTVLLNREILEQEFGGRGDEEGPDAARLSASVRSAISVDLIRALTASLMSELDDVDEWGDLAAGTVGQLAALRLTESFGSVAAGLNCYRDDEATFSRRLWNKFAPERWVA